MVPQYPISLVIDPIRNIIRDGASIADVDDDQRIDLMFYLQEPGCDIVPDLKLESYVSHRNPRCLGPERGPKRAPAPDP
jgi:hypothetical protein